MYKIQNCYEVKMNGSFNTSSSKTGNCKKTQIANFRKKLRTVHLFFIKNRKLRKKISRTENCEKKTQVERTSSSQKQEIAKKKHKNPANFGKKDKKSH